MFTGGDFSARPFQNPSDPSKAGWSIHSSQEFYSTPQEKQQQHTQQHSAAGETDTSST